MTRASTMVLALLLVHLLLGTLSLVVQREMERPLALRYWGLGLLTYGAGLLAGIPTGLPHDYNRVLSVAIVGLAAMLTSTGLLQNSDSRLNLRWVVTAYVVVIVALALNHIHPAYSASFDFLVASPFPNALFIYAAVALLRAPPQDAKTAGRFLAGILFVIVVMWIARIWLMVLALEGTNETERMDAVVSSFAVVQILIAISATLGLFWVEVRKLAAELLWLAGTDALTGLPNRRAMLIRFEEEAARDIRHRRPYSIIVFDIDSFKKVNDEYGHAFGDTVLKQVARELNAGKREVDAVGRLGGEEFLVLLSEEGAEGAAIAAERLHGRIHSVPTPDGSGRIALTLSGGVATAPDDGSGWDELFLAADRRMYEAKRAGRNRVVAGYNPAAKPIASA